MNENIHPPNQNENQETVWDKWLDQFIGGTRIPLFDMKNDGQVSSKTISKNRKIINRSKEMEDAIIDAVEFLFEDIDNGKDEFVGVLSLMYYIYLGKPKPLMFVLSRKWGREEGKLSANLKDCKRDSKSRMKFARWGDDDAYHFGGLSNALYNNTGIFEKRYQKWKFNLFREEDGEYVLKTPIYFAIKPWKRTDSIPSGEKGDLTKIITGLKENFQPSLMGSQESNVKLFNIDQNFSFPLFLVINKADPVGWEVEINGLPDSDDIDLFNINEHFRKHPDERNTFNKGMKNIISEISGQLFDKAQMEIAEKMMNGLWDGESLKKVVLSFEETVFLMLIMFPKLLQPNNIKLLCSTQCIHDLFETDKKPAKKPSPKDEDSIGIDSLFGLEMDDFLSDFSVDTVYGEFSADRKAQRYKWIDQVLLKKLENQLKRSNKLSSPLLGKRYDEQITTEQVIDKEDEGKLDDILTPKWKEKIAREDNVELQNALFKNRQWNPQTPVDIFQGELYDFQKEGLGFLKARCDENVGVLVGDDMGLGKTVQVIAYLCDRLKNNRLGKVLVVAPLSILNEWKKQLGKFAPTIQYFNFHGNNRDALLPKIRDCKDAVILTSYETLKNSLDDLSPIKWSGIIIDEAQKIKNINTANARAILSLDSDFRIAMSGTPIENHLLDLYAILTFLNPGMVGSIKDFRNRYVKPLENKPIYDLNNSPELKELQEIFKQISLRRTKLELQTMGKLEKPLPTSHERVILASMTDIQAKIHQSLIDIIKMSPNHNLMIKNIQDLKAVCDHPSLVLPDIPERYECSGKMIALFEVLEDIFAKNEKVVIFCQRLAIIDILKSEIYSKFNQFSLTLVGKDTLQDRIEKLNKFQENTTHNVLLISFLAGCEGINLSKTKHLVLFDSWWNSSKESQAKNRIYRIDQIHPEIFIYRFITENSIEFKIRELIDKKNTLVENVVGTSNGKVKELNLGKEESELIDNEMIFEIIIKASE